MLQVLKQTLYIFELANTGKMLPIMTGYWRKLKEILPEIHVFHMGSANKTKRRTLINILFIFLEFHPWPVFSSAPWDIFRCTKELAIAFECEKSVGSNHFVACFCRTFVVEEDKLAPFEIWGNDISGTKKINHVVVKD